MRQHAHARMVLTAGDGVHPACETPAAVRFSSGELVGIEQFGINGIRLAHDQMFPRFAALLATELVSELIRGTRDPSCQFMWSRYFSLSARLYAYSGFREIVALMGRGAWLQD